MWGTKKPEPVARPGVPGLPEQTATRPEPPVEGTAMNRNDAIRPATASERAQARLGASLHIKGEISGNEDLNVDGNVEGLISLEDRKLTVGPSAKVTADVVAREVVVYGNVKGNVRARDRIEIKKDGSVVGDLTTARIMIEDGAYFKGAIEIDRGTEPETNLEKPAFVRAARKSD